MSHKDGHKIYWRVAWIDPATAKERVEVLELVEASLLVGRLMGTGVGVIAIHDHTRWLEFQLDRIEPLVGSGKSL